MARPSLIDIVYTAGLFDGEGNISIYRRNLRKHKKSPEYALSCVITNTNPYVIDWLVKTFGGRVYKHQAVNRKLRFQWKMRCKQGGDFLRLICPYLIIKHPQALLALEFRQHFTGRGVKGISLPPDELEFRENARVKLMEMNRNGTSKGF